MLVLRNGKYWLHNFPERIRDAPVVVPYYNSHGGVLHPLALTFYAELLFIPTGIGSKEKLISKGK